MIANPEISLRTLNEGVRSKRHIPFRTKQWVDFSISDEIHHVCLAWQLGTTRAATHVMFVKVLLGQRNVDEEVGCHQGNRGCAPTIALEAAHAGVAGARQTQNTPAGRGWASEHWHRVGHQPGLLNRAISFPALSSDIARQTSTNEAIETPQKLCCAARQCVFSRKLSQIPTSGKVDRCPINWVAAKSDWQVAA